ncbi:MAG: hypothetical protein ACD_2C00152G0005 [uncultured bacterium (gcode 4)]|uniref:BioF2-like acetyltransferase domain-containing protein n=1 Tax=uncultured bacterium (gcode 4) TaxID=1234023 RepID=K2FED6_9BACT|nr:MAG: hypothetical protein ACD_2C00152G0005 [uncultured bacterium (gcode 4)]
MIKSVDNLEWYDPKNGYSDFIKSYFLPIINNWTSRYIRNIDADIKIIDVNWTLIPLSFWNRNEGNCYVTSLTWTFKYLQFETKYIKNAYFRNIVLWISKAILKVIEATDLNQIVYVNNLLLSTNLYPELSADDCAEIKEYLIKTYPSHAICFRSLSEFNKKLIDILENDWFKRIVSRQIFVSEKKDLSEYEKRTDVKNDKKLFENGWFEYEVKEEFTDIELQEIKDCYDNLYLKKYSLENPQFSLDFFVNIARIPLFKMNVLKKDGKIKAAFWYYKIGDTITTPIFWYTEPDLYRQMSYLLLLGSLNEAEVLNQSSGVGQFKMNRWAKKYLEYSLIHYKNLPLIKRVVWVSIDFIIKNFWEPDLKNNIY